MFTRRLIAFFGAAALTTGAAAVPASAMGSGDAYEDFQVGVSYTVYEPSYTAGLKAQHIGGNDLCPEGVDDELVAIYGKSSKRQFTLFQSNPRCADIGNGQVVLTTTIEGAKAQVVAYCDPASTAPCTRSSVKKFGGHLEVTLPAGGPGLKDTVVQIETFGANNLSAQQLVRIARSLAPVG